MRTVVQSKPRACYCVFAVVASITILIIYFAFNGQVFTLRHYAHVGYQCFFDGDLTAKVQYEIPVGQLKLLAADHGISWPPAAEQRFILGMIAAKPLLISPERRRLANSTHWRDWMDFLVKPLNNIKKPTVLVVSASFGDRPVGPLTRPPLEAYAKSKGYGFVYFDRVANASYVSQWQKILFLRAAMALMSRPEIIAWVDEDAVITNTSVRIENFFQLQAPKELSFVITQANIREPHHIFNAGVMMFRNNALIKQYFDKVLASYEEIPYYQSHPNWEQDVQNLVLLETPALLKQTLLLPLCVQHSFDANWQPGDFILHMPGLGDAERLRMIRFLLDNPVAKWQDDFPRARPPGIWPCDRS